MPTVDYDYIPPFVKNDSIPIIRRKKNRRKRAGITPRQVRMAIDVLRNGVEPQVIFRSHDQIKMANEAVEYCRTAMFRAMEILEGKLK